MKLQKQTTTLTDLEKTMKNQQLAHNEKIKA